MQFISPYLPVIHELCQKHNIEELWAFGSVIRPDFTHESDVDFLIEINDAKMTDEEYHFAFWGFKDALELLLNRKVDLVWLADIKNPYFLAEVQAHKLLIYDRSGEKISI